MQMLHNPSPRAKSPSTADRGTTTLWIHFSLIAAATGALLWSTWLTWQDVIVDFGREALRPVADLGGQGPILRPDTVFTVESAP